MVRLVRVLVVFVVIGMGLFAGTPSFAQGAPGQAAQPVRPLFSPRVEIGVAYDDNLFSQPNASFDTILRISPAIEIFRESRTATFTTLYSFDAERYRDFTDLSSPFVRQNASAAWTLRPSTRTTFALQGGYWRTQTPSDLNVTTGLVSARQLATQWNAGGELTRLVTPRSTIVAGYRYGQSDLADPTAVDTLSHTANLRFSHAVSPRTSVRVAYTGERWSFSPDGNDLSQLGTIGWTRQLTDATTFTVDAGPRYAAELLRPEVTASLARRVGERADMSIAYAHSQSIAIGVAGLIEVDSVQAGVTLRRPHAWELRLTGGGFRNVLSGAEVRAADASVEFSRAFGRQVWLVARGSGTFNTRVGGTGAPSEQQIQRNVVMLSLRVTPGSAR